MTIAIPIYRSHHTPEPRNPQKVSKRRSLGLPARSVKKVFKKSPNTDFVVFLTHFRFIWDFFDTYLTLRARRPRNAFLRLFGDFRPRGPRTPVYGGSNRNPSISTSSWIGQRLSLVLQNSSQVPNSGHMRLRQATELCNFA